MTSNPSEIHGVKVKFEPQNNDHFCGPACAIMILDAIGMRPPDQETLFNEINAFQTRDRKRGHEKWLSSPDGLKNTLNNRSGPNHQFTLYASLRQSDIARRLVNSISIFKAPCIALVESGIHWVVVYQYRKHGNEPTTSDDFLMRDILGLYIRDPFQEVPSEGFIDYNDWITGTQLAEDRGFWKDKFVAICDPEPDNNKKDKDMSSKKKKTFDGKSSGPVSLPNNIVSDKQDKVQNQDELPNLPSKLPDQNKPDPKDEDPKKPPITRIEKPGHDQNLINESTARTYTMWHLKPGGFYDPKKFDRMINNPNPGEPVLVHNLDTGDFYYITPILENNQQKSGMMCIDAKDARLLEAVFAMDVDKPFTFAKLSDKEITDLLVAKYGKPKKSKPISIMPILVWKRCIQSRSRFLPFHKAKIVSRTVYIRIDGSIFPRLTHRRRS